MGLPTYVSRQAFMSAADIHTPANLSATVDRILQAASRNIDQTFHRHFYPLTEAVTYSLVVAVKGSGRNVTFVLSLPPPSTPPHRLSPTSSYTRRNTGRHIRGSG
jgi:hypothetical protein